MLKSQIPTGLWDFLNGKTMAQNKTTETENSVSDFIKTLAVERQEDCLKLVAIFEDQTGLKAKMWGTSIIGFGSYHYKYESGREGDAPLSGFSPRKDKFALYFASSFKTREALLEKLGKHKTAKACVYIKTVNDVDISVLKQIIKDSTNYVKSLYP